MKALTIPLVLVVLVAAVYAVRGLVRKFRRIGWDKAADEHEKGLLP